MMYGIYIQVDVEPRPSLGAIARQHPFGSRNEELMGNLVPSLSGHLVLFIAMTAALLLPKKRDGTSECFDRCLYATNEGSRRNSRGLPAAMVAATIVVLL